MVRSQATTMKSRNRNGRTHAAFNAFDTPLSRFSSATSRSLMIVFSGEKLTRWINTGKRVFVRQFGLPQSFLRTQDPIATGVNCYCRIKDYRPTSRAAAYGSCVRRNDGLDRLVRRRPHARQLGLAK